MGGRGKPNVSTRSAAANDGDLLTVADRNIILEAIEKSSRDINSKIDGINNRLDGTDTRVDTLEAADQDKTQRIETLEKEVREFHEAKLTLQQARIETEKKSK